MEGILSVTIRRGRKHTNLYKLNLHSVHLLSMKESTDKTCTGEQENMHGKAGKYARMVHPEPPKPDPSKNHHRADGRDFVKKLLAGTMLNGADPGRVANASKKYKRTEEEVKNAIDVLDQQYSQSARKIENPTALIVCALKDGIELPKGYLPKAQRETEVERKREVARKMADEKLRAKETEDNAYEEAEAKLSALPDEKRKVLFLKATTKLPAFMRNSQTAIKFKAIELMLEDSKFPEKKGR